MAALPHASLSSASHQRRTTCVLCSLVKSSLCSMACRQGVQARASPLANRSHSCGTCYAARRYLQCLGCSRPARPTMWPRRQRRHTRRMRHTWTRQGTLRELGIGVRPTLAAQARAGARAADEGACARASSPLGSFADGRPAARSLCHLKGTGQPALHSAPAHSVIECTL